MYVVKTHFSFWGSAFQVFRQMAEQCGRSFGKTIFWGGKDLPKLQLIARAEEGFGEESARAPAFFCEILMGYKIKNHILKKS
jgi:hypothetical protein